MQGRSQGQGLHNQRNQDKDHHPLTSFRGQRGSSSRRSPIYDTLEVPASERLKKQHIRGVDSHEWVEESISERDKHRPRDSVYEREGDQDRRSSSQRSIKSQSLESRQSRSPTQR
eukprot:11463710-Karenia_brevis.AAC.1